MVAGIGKEFLSRILGTALLAIAMLVTAGCGDVYLHEQFDKLVMSKSEAEVQSAIGKPTAVDSNNPARVTWTYYSKTADIENQNKRDVKTVLIFEPDQTTKKLKVVKIEYQKG